MESGKGAMESLGLMKVFVAGGNGFIGSGVVRKFLNENAEVHVLTRKTSNLWRIEEIKPHINLHYGDLSSPNNIDGVVSSLKPDVVINCSGIVRGFGLEDQNDVIQSNFVNTLNLVNSSLRSGVETLLNTGSAYECGFSDIPISVNSCNEKPIGLYGVVKKAERYYIDMINRSYAKSYINFRLFTPFGFFDAPFRLIPHVIISLMHGIEPEIRNPAAGRSFIFLEDIANIYYAAATNPERLRGLTQVNLGSPGLMSVSEVVSSLYGMFERHFTYETKEYSGNKEFLFPDPKEVINFLSSLNVNLTPLQEGLTKTVKWFRDNEIFYSDNAGAR